MSDIPEMTLAEAIAVSWRLKTLGYPNKLQRAIADRAERIIDREVKRVVDEQANDVCTTCWGDGFHRTRPEILSGPCHTCNGTGRQHVTDPSPQPAEG